MGHAVRRPWSLAGARRRRRPPRGWWLLVLLTCAYLAWATSDLMDVLALRQPLSSACWLVVEARWAQVAWPHVTRPFEWRGLTAFFLAVAPAMRRPIPLLPLLLAASVLQALGL